jgi:hypothetical protein
MRSSRLMDSSAQCPFPIGSGGRTNTPTTTCVSLACDLSTEVRSAVRSLVAFAEEMTGFEGTRVFQSQAAMA